MRDKHTAAEREYPLPAPCLECKSLQRKYKTMLCLSRRLKYARLELLRSIPVVRRLAPLWECEFRDEVAE